MRRVQAQVSLGICPVWSESSLSAWRSLGSLATHFVGFVMLRLKSLLCKSIKLRQLILSFFLFCGCQGGKGDGTDVYIIRDSVHFSLQYEICKMRKFWGQSWSYVISIQKDWKKIIVDTDIQILKQNTCRANHKKNNICCHPTDPEKLPLPKTFYWSSWKKIFF